MSTLVLVLFVIAWAAIAFAVIRALAVAWGSDRRLAAATAVAVAGAFALGAISPFALPSHQSMVAAQPATVAAPTAAARAVACPAAAVLGHKDATGHLDSVTVGDSPPLAAAGPIDVPAGSPLQLGGWIVLAGGPAKTICAIVDGRAVAATTLYGIARPDVAVALGKATDGPSGFQVTLSVKPGAHTVGVGAVEADGQTVDNMHGVPLSVQAH